MLSKDVDITHVPKWVFNVVFCFELKGFINTVYNNWVLTMCQTPISMYLILTPTLWDIAYYPPHFTDADAEASGDSLEIQGQLVSGWARSPAQAARSRVCDSHSYHSFAGSQQLLSLLTLQCFPETFLLDPWGCWKATQELKLVPSKKLQEFHSLTLNHENRPESHTVLKWCGKILERAWDSRMFHAWRQEVVGNRSFWN